MRAPMVEDWFAGYLSTFAAFGRGERADLDELLPFYDVPLLLTTDAGALVLDSREDVGRALQGQIDGMRASGYHHSAVLGSEVETLNAVSALYRGHFSRRRADGGELGRLRATYLIVDRGAGPRIAALVVHGG